MPTYIISCHIMHMQVYIYIYIYILIHTWRQCKGMLTIDCALIAYTHDMGQGQHGLSIGPCIPCDGP